MKSSSSPIHWKWNNGGDTMQKSSRRPPQIVAEDTKPQTHQETKVFETNKREECADKIASRDMVFQRGINPFATDSDYVKDIAAQDAFLTPMNTTLGRLNDK